MSFWERVLDGTLLKDVLDDCVKPLRDVLAEADGERSEGREAPGERCGTQPDRRGQPARATGEQLARLARVPLGRRARAPREALPGTHRGALRARLTAAFATTCCPCPLSVRRIAGSRPATGAPRTVVCASTRRAAARTRSATARPSCTRSASKDDELEREVTLSGQNLEVLDVLPAWQVRARGGGRRQPVADLYARSEDARAAGRAGGGARRARDAPALVRDRPRARRLRAREGRRARGVRAREARRRSSPASRSWRSTRPGIFLPPRGR